MLKVYVWGARRTGTNLLEYIVLNNTEALVPNLNRGAGVKIPFVDRRPHEYDEWGSKHSLVDKGDKFNPEGRHVAVIREPLSWLDARLRYASEHMNQTLSDENVEKIIRQEWNSFYGKVAAAGLYVVKFEELISVSVESAVRNFTVSNGIDCRVEFRRDSPVLAPGGGIAQPKTASINKNNENSIGAIEKWIDVFDVNLIDLYYPGGVIGDLCAK